MIVNDQILEIILNEEEGKAIIQSAEIIKQLNDILFKEENKNKKFIMYSKYDNAEPNQLNALQSLFDIQGNFDFLKRSLL